MDTQPHFSVIIAAYNDAVYLAECLDALARQDYPKDGYEVIVVDDGSTDSTAEVVAARSWARYIHQDNAGPSAARNTGVLAAKGDVVAFTDSDCAPEPGWLSALATQFAEGDSRLAAVGGPHIGHPDDPPFAKELEVFLQRIGWMTDYMKGSPRPADVFHVPSCNVAHKQSVFESVGGFRPGLYPGEDVDLDRRILKAGYRIRFTPEARVFHHRPGDSRAWHRMLQRYGESSGNIIRLHGPFRPIHFLPPLLLGNVLLLLLLFIVTRIGPWAVLAEGIAGLLICAHLGRSPLDLLKAFRFATATAVCFSIGFWTRLLCFRPLPIDTFPPRNLPT